MASLSALPVDVMELDANTLPSHWTQWLVPLLVLGAVLGVLHRTDRQLFRTMAPLSTVTRRGSGPAPNIIRQMRDDMTLTPPWVTALGAFVAMGVHLGVAVITVLGSSRRVFGRALG